MDLKIRGGERTSTVCFSFFFWSFFKMYLLCNLKCLVDDMLPQQSSGGEAEIAAVNRSIKTFYMVGRSLKVPKSSCQRPHHSAFLKARGAKDERRGSAENRRGKGIPCVYVEEERGVVEI